MEPGYDRFGTGGGVVEAGRLQELTRRREVAEAAALAAAAVHLRYRGGGIEFAVKNGNPGDLVTAADTEGEAAARGVIGAAFPSEAIVGEEDGSSRERQAELLADAAWLIDPLDGTFNFVHGFPDFCATVAFVEDGRPVAGAVYAPVTGELFSAARELGASLNGDPIYVSERRGLEASIANVYGPREDLDYQERILRLRDRVFAQRNFGGTALVLAYLAAGRYDLFFTPDNPYMGPWDIAAGAVLVEEAGGVVQRADGSPFRLPSLSLAAAAHLSTLDELRAVLA
jgi:myo-inositol-1(or 4)-monophosphatase